MLNRLTRSFSRPINYWKVITKPVVDELWRNAGHCESRCAGMMAQLVIQTREVVDNLLAPKPEDGAEALDFDRKKLEESQLYNMYQLVTTGLLVLLEPRRPEQARIMGNLLPDLFTRTQAAGGAWNRLREDCLERSPREVVMRLASLTAHALKHVGMEQEERIIAFNRRFVALMMAKHKVLPKIFGGESEQHEQRGTGTFARG